MGRRNEKRKRERVMTMKKSMSVAVVLVLAVIAGVSAVCPPPGYDSVEPFSLEAYGADGIDGQQQNAGGFQLNAVVRDAAVPSKLAVGPPFLPPVLYGPYWVVAAGPYSPNDPEWTGTYEWAIITGGEP